MIDLNNESGKFVLNNVTVYHDSVIFDIIFWAVIDQEIISIDQRDICLKIVEIMDESEVEAIKSNYRIIYMVGGVGIAHFSFINGEAFIHFIYNSNTKTVELIDPNEISLETKIILEETLRKSGVCKTNSTAVLRMILNDPSYNLRDDEDVVICNEST